MLNAKLILCHRKRTSISARTNVKLRITKARKSALANARYDALLQPFSSKSAHIHRILPKTKHEPTTAIALHTPSAQTHLPASDSIPLVLSSQASVLYSSLVRQCFVSSSFEKQLHWKIFFPCRFLGGRNAQHRCTCFALLAVLPLPFLRTPTAPPGQVRSAGLAGAGGKSKCLSIRRLKFVWNRRLAFRTLHRACQEEGFHDLSSFPGAGSCRTTIPTRSANRRTLNYR